jgi:hypothetical protein
VPDGRLSPGSQALARQEPAGASLRLTPFGAYAIEPGQPNLLAVFDVADRYRVRSRRGPTGRLTPAGACVLRPDPRTALEPGGSVFVGASQRRRARIAPSAEWRQVPPTIRAAARAAGWVPARAAPPPCDAALSHLPGPQEAGFEVDRLGDACDCEGTYECALYEKVIMDYVGYRLCVPARWFWRRYEADDWLGAGDTMEELWRAVNGTGSGVSADTMDALIGCWMIDTAGDRQGRSYGMFFPEGNAPRKFLRYTLDLVLRFSDEIVDEWSGTTSCAGLRAFIERTLAGKEGDTLTEDVGPCKVVFRAVSSTTWLGSHAVQRSCGEATERAMDCAAAGDTPDAFGTAFDDWSQRLDASFQGVADGQWKTVFELRVDSGRAASWDQPAASWLGYAQTDGGVMLVAANRIAFRGYQLDFTMFWARVALQYAYERGDWKAWYGSWVYTRAALSNMVEYGRLWVHEMGHLHMGQGGHCSGKSASRVSTPPAVSTSPRRRGRAGLRVASGWRTWKTWSVPAIRPIPHLPIPAGVGRSTTPTRCVATGCRTVCPTRRRASRRARVHDGPPGGGAVRAGVGGRLRPPAGGVGVHRSGGVRGAPHRDPVS